MSLAIETFPLGPLETNCYVVRDGGECWIVDPGMWPDPLLRYFEQAHSSPDRVVLTHAHGDHIASADQFKHTFPRLRFLCPAAEADMLSDPGLNMSMAFGVSITAPEPDETFAPGDVLECGNAKWQVLDTSGHSPGGVSFYCESARVVLTGDALFAGSIGRTDIPGADQDQLLANIRQNLLGLPGATRVLPGHGPETTIQQEIETNPFLRD